MEKRLFALHAVVEESHWWFVGRRRIMRVLVGSVAPPGSTIVDFGCGTGANIDSLSAEFTTFGIDPSEEAIDLARARFPRTRFIQGTTESSAQLPAAPDVALMMDVMEHVEDDFALLAAALDEVAIGGHLLITVPAGMHLWSSHDVAFQHFRRYDFDRLSATWSGQPVRVRLLSHFCTRLYWPIRLIRAASRASGRTGDDLSLPIGLVNRALSRLFAGEASRLLKAVDGPGERPGRRGSSIIAVLQRTEGDVLPKRKPETLIDPHRPQSDS